MTAYELFADVMVMLLFLGFLAVVYYCGRVLWWLLGPPR